MRPAALLALVVPVLLAGCGHSPPTRFFTLDPIAPGASSAAPEAARAAVAPVQLGAVHIPAALDRPELVTRIGPNRLQLKEQDQWGAPLGEMIRRTLAQDLLSRLPAGALVPLDSPKPPDARGLVVDILDLETDADGRVRLQASWTLTGGGAAESVRSRQVDLTATAASADSAAQAGAISRLIGELADGIAAGLAGA